MKYCSKQGEKIMVILIILMSKFEFRDKVLIKLIVGVVKHVTIRPFDYKCSSLDGRASTLRKLYKPTHCL
jgi:hypothetical protein